MSYANAIGDSHLRCVVEMYFRPPSSLGLNLGMERWYEIAMYFISETQF
ncbi:hypothetical protein GQ41_3301 [Arenibacter algicola]|uniref:Aminoacyl-tRNA synthetase class II (D/K/N) domain-containing protein n=1 Tax=Arenibacter algicola TaxID=616991 RepID=A0ABY3ADC6_9FLAO